MSANTLKIGVPQKLDLVMLYGKSEPQSHPLINIAIRHIKFSLELSPASPSFPELNVWHHNHNYLHW